MIYMEVMVASLDSCYEVLQAKEMPFPEDVLTYIAISVSARVWRRRWRRA